MSDKNTNKKRVIVGAVLVVGAALGYAGYLQSKKPQARQAGIRSGQGTWDELKKSHSMTVNTHLSSKTGRAWKNHDFGALMSSFGPERTMKENKEFFQASIYVLDVSSIQWKPEEKKDLQALQSKIVKFLTEDGKGVVGDVAQTHSFAAKTLLRLGTPSAQELKALEGFHKGSRDAFRREIVADVLIQTEPLSGEGRALLTKMLLSKTEVNEGLQMLARVRDGEARKELLNRVYKNYANYPAAMKPFVYKQLVLNHSLIQGDLKKHLAEAAKSKDEVWEDSFLVAVQELNVVSEFTADIQRIEKQSQYPHLKMLAGAILAKDKGIK
ncbi:hypothetical protein [Bdellovibrio bacteriovorus]|uniref:hypothetical protein n=1 Tax=Bdellovibrio bacteriovorus TaxID=959 RepID=UPI003A806DD1